MTEGRNSAADDASDYAEDADDRGARALRHAGQGGVSGQVAEYNQDQIRDPDLIYPGQVFVLPNVKGPEADKVGARAGP
ncbi:hypothetical protein FMGBMHLM_0686 [Methylobacterium aerolatum]|nr:hypothetical protein FMGBMHLM_0686 [Methylobacterium aerolatum]